MAKTKRIFREWQHPRDHRGRFARKGSPEWVRAAAQKFRNADEALKAGTSAPGMPGGNRRGLSRGAKAERLFAAHDASVTTGLGRQPTLGPERPPAERIKATDLKAGDRIRYADTPVTILSGPTKTEDRFGREMMRFEGRREDTGKTGGILLGPTGTVERDVAKGASASSTRGRLSPAAKTATMQREAALATLAPPERGTPENSTTGLRETFAPGATPTDRKVVRAVYNMNPHQWDQLGPDRQRNAGKAVAAAVAAGEPGAADAATKLRKLGGYVPEPRRVDTPRANGQAGGVPSTTRGRLSAATKTAALAPKLSPEQRANYDKLLGSAPGEGLIANPNARKIVEQMEQHGWQVASQSPQVSLLTFKSPDGRYITTQFLLSTDAQRGGAPAKPIFRVGQGMRARDLTFKAAMAEVVTPPLAERQRPNINGALERLGLPRLEEHRFGGTNETAERNAGRGALVEAQKDLMKAGAYGGRGRTLDEAVANLREAAQRNRENAKKADELYGYGSARDSRSAQWEASADQYEKVADELLKMQRERQAYEAERDRRAALPLDIRPTPRGAKPKAAKAVKAAAPAVERRADRTPLNPNSPKAADIQAVIDAMPADLPLDDQTRRTYISKFRGNWSAIMEQDNGKVMGLHDAKTKGAVLEWIVNAQHSRNWLKEANAATARGEAPSPQRGLGAVAHAKAVAEQAAREQGAELADIKARLEKARTSGDRAEYARVRAELTDLAKRNDAKIAQMRKEREARGESRPDPVGRILADLKRTMDEIEAENKPKGASQGFNEPTAERPFGFFAQPNSAMGPSDREGQRVEIRAGDRRDEGVIVGQVGGLKAAGGPAGNSFYVVKHDDGTYNTYDTRVVHEVKPKGAIERASDAIAAQRGLSTGRAGLDELAQQTPGQREMDVIRTTSALPPAGTAVAYDQMDRSTLLVLARQAKIPIREYRGKDNAHLAGLLRAKDEQNKAAKAAKLNPSGVGAPSTQHETHTPTGAGDPNMMKLTDERLTQGLQMYGTNTPQGQKVVVEMRRRGIDPNSVPKAPEHEKRTPPRLSAKAQRDNALTAMNDVIDQLRGDYAASEPRGERNVSTIDELRDTLTSLEDGTARPQDAASVLRSLANRHQGSTTATALRDAADRVEGKPKAPEVPARRPSGLQTFAERMAGDMSESDRLAARLRNEEQRQQLRAQEAERARQVAEAEANDTRSEREKLTERLQQARAAQDINMRFGRVDPARAARIRAMENRLEELNTEDRKAKIKALDIRNGDKVRNLVGEFEVVGKTKDGYLRVLRPDGKRGSVDPRHVEAVTKASAPKAEAAQEAAPDLSNPAVARAQRLLDQVKTGKSIYFRAGDQWMIMGPSADMEPGRRITVHKADGSTTEVIVGEIKSDRTVQGVTARTATFRKAPPRTAAPETVRPPVEAAPKPAPRTGPVDEAALRERYSRAADRVAMLDGDNLNGRRERAAHQELADARQALLDAGLPLQAPRDVSAQRAANLEKARTEQRRLTREQLTRSTDPTDNGAKIRALESGNMDRVSLYRTANAGPSGQRTHALAGHVEATPDNSNGEYRIRNRDGETVGWVSRTVRNGKRVYSMHSQNAADEQRLEGWSGELSTAADILVNGEFVARGYGADARRASSGTFERYAGRNMSLDELELHAAREELRKAKEHAANPNLLPIGRKSADRAVEVRQRQLDELLAEQQGAKVDTPRAKSQNGGESTAPTTEATMAAKITKAQQPYTEGRRVEIRQTQFHKPGMPSEWQSGTVEDARVQDNGLLEFRVKLDNPGPASGGYSERVLVGPRGGNKSVRPLEGEAVAPAVAKAKSTGEPQLGVTESSKGRTTTVTLPDGTTATRTSKTMAYTHAIVGTTDNRAAARRLRAQAAESQRFIDALQAWIAAGSDVSKLEKHPTGLGPRSGQSIGEYYLPGFGPVRHVSPRSRYGGGGTYLNDDHNYGIVDPNHPYNNSAEYVRIHGATATEKYGPAHLLKFHTERRDRQNTEADKLDAGPAESHAVYRWSQSLQNAMSGRSEFEAIPDTRLQIVGVGGVAKETPKVAKAVPTAEEKAAAKAAKAATEAADRAASNAKFFADTRARIEKDIREGNDPEGELKLKTEAGLRSLAREYGVKLPRQPRTAYGQSQPLDRENARKLIVEKIRADMGAPNARQQAVIDIGTSFSGNPYSKLPKLEALTDEDFRGLTPDQQDNVRFLVHKLTQRAPGESTDRAKALQRRFGRWGGAASATPEPQGRQEPFNPRVATGGTPVPRLEGETDTAYTLRTAPSDHAAETMLNGYTVGALRALARDNRVSVPASAGKAQLVAAIKYALRQRWLDSKAIAGR